MIRRAFGLVTAVALLGLLPIPAAADSPDDDTFVFISTNDENNFHVTISNGRGGGRRKITSRITLWRPAISPDGTKIAFSAPVGRASLGVYGIAVANLDGTGFKMLTSPRNADFSPTWSPDGTQIAFIRDTKANLDNDTCCVLRVMDADGTNLTTIANTRGASNPAWSPAGNEIAYDTSEGIFVTTVDGTRKRTIAGTRRSQPAWSPDGSEIVFVRETATEHDIVVTNRNGANGTIWYSTAQTLESPTWDLDGNSISFVRHSGIGHLGRTGTQVWSVTRSGAAERLFVAGNKIVHLARYTRRGPECDFDGDARSDLAVGLPGQIIDGNAAAGAVEIMYGGGSGLSPTGSQQLHRGLPFVAGNVAAHAAFGESVVCGDFNGDLFSDLAIGAPGSSNGRGSVTVMYGTPGGLNRLGSVWHQNSGGVVGSAEAGERFGSALGAGDFDGDGYFDLAIGTPQDRINGDATGSVNVLYGGPDGLTTVGDQLWHQNVSGIKGSGVAGDQFGAALASADFDGDGRDDLAVGVPGDRRKGKKIGAVNVIYGGKRGLGAAGDEWWHQQSAGVMSKGRRNERFGAALAAGDFGGDGDGDLAIGVPRDRRGGEPVGAINVLYGQPGGLGADYDDYYHQNSPGIGGVAKRGDNFGRALIAGDFDGDNRTDLAIGIPGDTPQDKTAGVVAVLYAKPTGLDPQGSQRWFQDVPEMAGVGEDGDRLGASVAVGDFDGDGYVDLAIGVPGEGMSGFGNAGAIHVIYGRSSGLSVSGDQFWHQGVDGMSGSLQTNDAFGASMN